VGIHNWDSSAWLLLLLLHDSCRFCCCGVVFAAFNAAAAETEFQGLQLCKDTEVVESLLGICNSRSSSSNISRFCKLPSL
jgi:hypothetical protein